MAALWLPLKETITVFVRPRGCHGRGVIGRDT